MRRRSEAEAMEEAWARARVRRQLVPPAASDLEQTQPDLWAPDAHPLREIPRPSRVLVAPPASLARRRRTRGA